MSKKNKRQESDQTVMTTLKRLPKRLTWLYFYSQKVGADKNVTCFSPWHVPPTFKFVPAPLDRPASSLSSSS